MAARSQVRFHGATTTAASSFQTAPDQHKTGMTALETVKNIGSAGSWVSFLNVQTDPEYRALVTDVLDRMRPLVEPRDPGMYGYAGWIFLTSPGVVTPYHMDRENNFILQIRGRKTIHVWDPNERSVISPLVREEFNTFRSREKATYKDEFLPYARVFDAKPGDGAYMPSNGPHWVKNGDAISITASFTYYTRGTKRYELLCRANSALRRLGLNPRAPGDSRLRDGVKRRLFTGYTRAKALVRPEVESLPFGERYAPHEA